jgi:hypothetical protein
MPAVSAGFNMTPSDGFPTILRIVGTLAISAHGSCAAGLDRCHHLELDKAQMPGMGSPVGWACGAEDIGDLK